MINKIWSYRGFILGNVRREFQAKYRNSLLGSLWSIIQPLSMIVVYTVIFANVMRAKLPGVDSTFAYGIYLCAGTLTWGLFAEITGRAQTVFIENANLIKKLNFPRICLPVVVILNAGLNFAIIFSLFTAFLILTGNFPGWVFWPCFPYCCLKSRLPLASVLPWVCSMSSSVMLANSSACCCSSGSGLPLSFTLSVSCRTPFAPGSSAIPCPRS